METTEVFPQEQIEEQFGVIPVPQEQLIAEVTTFNTSSTSTSSSSTLTIDRLDEQLTNMLDILGSYKTRLKGLRCLPSGCWRLYCRSPQWLSLIGRLRNAVGEHVTLRYLGSWKMQCTWLRVRGRVRGTLKVMDGVRDGFLRICMPRLIFRSFSACCTEKLLILRLHAIQMRFFHHAWGRSTDSVIFSDVRPSYTVPFVGLLVFLQSSRSKRSCATSARITTRCTIRPRK